MKISPDSPRDHLVLTPEILGEGRSHVRKTDLAVPAEDAEMITTIEKMCLTVLKEKGENGHSCVSELTLVSAKEPDDQDETYDHGKTVIGKGHAPKAFTPGRLIKGNSMTPEKRAQRLDKLVTQALSEFKREFDTTRDSGLKLLEAGRRSSTHFITAHLPELRAKYRKDLEGTLGGPNDSDFYDFINDFGKKLRKGILLELKGRGLPVPDVEEYEALYEKSVGSAKKTKIPEPALSKLLDMGRAIEDAFHMRLKPNEKGGTDVTISNNMLFSD